MLYASKSALNMPLPAAVRVFLCSLSEDEYEEAYELTEAQRQKIADEEAAEHVSIPKHILCQ